MKFVFVPLVLAFMVSGIFHVASHNLCSEYTTDVSLSEDEKSFSLIKETGWTFPLTVSFSASVFDIKSSSVRGEMITPDEWVLEVVEENSSNATSLVYSLLFRVVHNSTKIRITQIEGGGRTLCESFEVVRGRCGLTGKLDLSAENILLRKAAWNSGRNFHIMIPSKPTFVGYVVDLFFTKPVTKITVANPSIRVVNLSPIHWAFAKNWTEPTCIKLIDIFFTINYKEWSDVEAMLLNNHYVYPLDGHGKTSQTIFENRNLQNATKVSCSSFFVDRGLPWFGETIGRSLWFEARIKPQYHVGLVIDLIFEEQIEEFRVWKLHSEKIEGNHWRLHNAGWTIPADGLIRFDFLIIYVEHYYVKPVGIKINNEIICGLGISPNLLLHENDDKGQRLTKERKIYVEIIGSVTLVGFTILTLIIILGSLAIGRMKVSPASRQYLYNPAEGSGPGSERSDPTYLSVLSDSVASEETCTSHI